METTMKCKKCGQDLPDEAFRLTKGGVRSNTCTECINSATKAAKQRQQFGGGSRPFSDPDFDGKTIREVMDIMSRAKRWMESRGCIINLSGEHHETKIRKLKFE